MSKDRKDFWNKENNDVRPDKGKGAGSDLGKGEGGGGGSSEEIRKSFEDYQNQRERTQEHSGPTPEEEKFYFGEED